MYSLVGSGGLTVVMGMARINGIKSGIALLHEMCKYWADSITTMSEFKTVNI